jgi:hypothetical protein
MFCLYGMRSIGTSFEVRILVATFDTREAAEQYVQDSFVPHSERLIMRHPYHSASVLGAYTDYEIEEGGGIPHNPVRNW